MVYNIAINKVDRIDYANDKFKYNVFLDYLLEGSRCYIVDKQLLKNIELYKYIEEILNERN